MTGCDSMPNIFKSKEIFKHVIRNGSHELIPVRGVYVAGTYRPPYLIDQNIDITYIGGRPAAITPYSKVTVTFYNDCVIPNMELIPAPPTIKWYTIASTNAYSDTIKPTLTFESQSPNVIWYTTGSSNFYNDIVKCNMEFSSESTITYDLTPQESTQNDFVVSINNITGSVAVVE